MSIAPRLLIIDDDPDVAIAAQMLLRRRYGDIMVVNDPKQVPTLLKNWVPDLVLLDFNFTAGRTDGAEGLAMLDLLRLQTTPPTVIAMTAYADVPLAVEALKRGAGDFITKPWDNTRLLAAVESALARRAPNKAHDGALSMLMGQSPAMCELRAMISNVAPTEANVMILGENGVGKELVAKAIHLSSPRKGASFLAVDMGAIPESTFESEMYGHKKGAFTDARNDRSGRFQAAKGGVLFLDEIGNLALAGQAKLLTVLERREVTPVGLDTQEKIDVRIVSATNLSEVKLFDPAYFRSDLLFRLNTIVIRVPALREHAEDIPELLQHYLRIYEQQYQKPARQLNTMAVARLSALTWPGNVRALRHACERAVILGTQVEYQFEDFGVSTPANLNVDRRQDPGLTPATTSLPPVSEGEFTTEVKKPSLQAENFSLSTLEREAINNALAQASGNISQAAKLLGLSRAALYRKLEKYEL
jgi:DNA-binding NtrC family response regulator